MNPAYLDVTYYLLFSALEIVTHRFGGPGDFAQLATPFLRDRYGFHVFQDDRSQPLQSMQNYAHLSNRLFHNGEITLDGVATQINGV